MMYMRLLYSMVNESLRASHNFDELIGVTDDGLSLVMKDSDDVTGFRIVMVSQDIFIIAKQFIELCGA